MRTHVRPRGRKKIPVKCYGLTPYVVTNWKFDAGPIVPAFPLLRMGFANGIEVKIFPNVWTYL